MERIWSYLRRFGRMTKEMRPAHRIDVLSSALNYWGHKKKQTLCMFMCYYGIEYDYYKKKTFAAISLLKRSERAQALKNDAEENLQRFKLQCMWLINVTA